MQDLLTYLEAEQPKINEALDREVGELHPLVQATIKHVLSAGGKRLRPLLTMLTARCLGYGRDDIYPLACALEFLHSATLLHDDILDGAELRRGLPAAHTVFGSTQTILAGDALLALGNKIMARPGIPKLTECISEAIMHTATGEIAEIAHVRNAKLTEAQYLDIITGKTAYLIQASCRVGAILGKANKERERAAASFGLSLGIAFQLVDDALDYASTSEATGKPVGADILEGKVTLPLLLYLRDMEGPERETFTRQFEKKILVASELSDIADKVRQGGYADQTRTKAKDYADRARDSLLRLPDNKERKLLETALDYVLTRDK